MSVDAVARLELVVGPLADVTAPPADELVAELDRLAADPPRALLLVAFDGVGAVEDRPPTPAGLRDPAAVLAAFPAPTVAWWDGPAAGAGAELLLAADVRVVGPGATLSFPEVELGTIPCWGATQRLPRLVGIAAAVRLLMVGETLGTDALARLGLAEPGGIAEAEALGDRLAHGAPRAQAAARDAVERGRDLTLIDGLRLEADLGLLIATTHDREEGITAFFEKRAPRFTGE
jgi:enoyl-CoA hydratase/carnithine racemase